MKYILTMLLCLCTSCAAQVRGPAVPESAPLAVAGFVHPENDWELMAGVLPEEPLNITEESLDALDASLQAALKNRKWTFMSPPMVRQCEELVLAEKERRRFETVEYWQAVGECMPADYILVPFILHWQEREGGEWGVTRPAMVIMDMYLIEVASGQVRRYHFEEKQQSLGENLLKGRLFLKRKGRWVTPLDIAEEAMESGLEELGL
jgi:hypothetical protein